MFPPGDPNFEPVVALYPFCTTDPLLFRITARATAGVGGRESTVLLQSTIVVDP